MKRSTTTNTNHNDVQFMLKIPTSQYSKLYSKYLRTEWHQVEQLIRNIVKRPFCRQYYLKFPLEALIKGISKKLLMNAYEIVLYAYFLSQAQWQLEWRVNSQLSSDLAEVFPNIIHVNEPTDTQILKKLSIYLTLSCFSVKQFLNQDVQILKDEMNKIFPQFEQLLAFWTSLQPTVGKILHPKALNCVYRSLINKNSVVDYNTCVDRVLQISPCYNITNSGTKEKQTSNFGYLNNNLQQPFEFNMYGQVKEQDIGDFQFQGDI